MEPSYLDQSDMASDHYIYLRMKEYRMPAFDFASPQKTARKFVVGWVAYMCKNLNLCVETHHLAIALFDYFLDRLQGATLKVQSIKLVALCCLRISG